ncbi:derlin-2, partial [Striga asiatica]
MDDSAVRKKVRDSYIGTRSGRRSSRRWSLGCGRDAVTTTRRRGMKDAVSVAYTWSRRIAWRCDGRRPELRRILDFWGRVVDERSFENWILVGLHLNLGWSVIDFLIECWAALRKIELGQEGKVVGLWADKGDDL